MKKSKKFVLAALALLAITMVLLPLAGCKNDSVPPEVEKQEQGDGGGSETDKNNTAAKLVSISVTPSARTVYSVGEKVAGEIEVTATYDDRTTSTVTGTITTDTSTLTQSAGIGKPVTVSYMEGGITREDTFTVDVASYQFTETVQDTGGNYKKFGDWPQTIKEEGVEIGSGTLVRGGLTYHVGSDGNYYVKITAKPYEDTYTYSDGNLVEKDKEVYFKVEPIVWRVLTTNYTAPPEGGTVGEILLLAESILTGGIPYYHFDWEEGGLSGMEWNGPRIIGNKTIHPNNYEHSQIRAWLNGLSYESKESEEAKQSSKDEYKNAGFLQTAFTESAQKLIELTSVDNSAASTTDAGSNLLPATKYACANTMDKVFLLSEKEATTSDYGFDEYDRWVGDDYVTTSSTRIRVTTDYAKATGAEQGSYGGRWWLRSPFYYIVSFARGIDDGGNPSNYSRVSDTRRGVVPALSISLQ